MDVARPDMHPRLTIFKPRHFALVPVLGGLPVLILKTRLVNPLPRSGPFQRFVGPIGPTLAGLFQPFRVCKIVGLLCPALLGLLAVGPLEPRSRLPVVAVQAALGDHQVSMGIHWVAVDRQRIGQLPIPSGEIGSEARGQLTLLPIVQFDRQGNLDLNEQPPVGAFVVVRRRPILPGVVLGPSRHIAGFLVCQVLAVLGILPLPFDVFRFGLSRLPAAPASDTHIEVIDSHAVYADLTARRTSFSKRNFKVRPLFLSG